MCESCYRAVCTPRCPYHEDTARRVCEKCGEPIFADSSFYRLGGRYLCEDCADELTVDELLELGNYATLGDLFSALGG